MQNRVSVVHNGVILPRELEAASDERKDAYAAQVKLQNGAFVRAHFALEDAAERAGLSLDDLERGDLERATAAAPMFPHHFSAARNNPDALTLTGWNEDGTHAGDIRLTAGTALDVLSVLAQALAEPSPS